MDQLDGIGRANGKTMSPLATWRFFMATPYTQATGAGLIDLTDRICRADPCPVVVDGRIAAIAMNGDPKMLETWMYSRLSQYPIVYNGDPDMRPLIGRVRAKQNGG